MSRSCRPSALVLPVAVLLLTFGATPVPVAAQEEADEPPPRELGRVDFPVPASGPAAAWFERGLLLLHSFEYGDAEAAFRRASEADPDFALAHWGEAMTHNHPLWREQDRAAARAALDRLAPTPEARRAKAETERGKAYLDAVETLYGEGPKARRDTLYARAMEGLADRFPDDEDAEAFHALSLLGLSQGDRDVPTYMRAGAVALRLFGEHPRHPGAAHYAIHAFDDPTHAPLGLEAARVYGDLAPGAAHARHMTSHIFLALGMWEDVVAANEAASRTTAADRSYGGEHFPCGHYAEWLTYGYLQQGRRGDARALADGCRRLMGQEGRLGSVARMRALYLVDARAWDGAMADLALDPDRLSPWWRAVDRFADGLAAARRGQVDGARDALRSLEAGGEGLPTADDPRLRILATQLRAALALVEGRGEEALATAREAADLEAERPVPFGPPSTFLPPRELEGEILLELGRADEAARAYRLALERTPRRARSLLGLARAASAAGRTADASAAYAELAALWEGADEGWPGAGEVRRRAADHHVPEVAGGGVP